MKRYVVLGIACAAALNMYAQQVKAPKYGKKLSSREVVEYLASDALAGRDGATRGDTLASDFIFGQMKKLGLEGADPAGWIPWQSTTGQMTMLPALQVCFTLPNSLQKPKIWSTG